MDLIGLLDSPYVRRVAISLTLLGVPFRHRALSVFRDYAEFKTINPVVKAPTLVCDDGEIIIDSTLILDHIEGLIDPAASLMPAGSQRQHALHAIGLALAACEKTAQIAYERNLRPAEKQHQPWLDRVSEQLTAAYDLLETAVAARSGPWLCADRPLQPDITVAVAWGFTQYVIAGEIDASRYPALSAFAAQAEALPVFQAIPIA
ncbi:MAG: glutathione S-transferase [Azospirillaceae bacterium]|nr:glutathione S-transferase [Azospirillaceae bacterium]